MSRSPRTTYERPRDRVRGAFRARDNSGQDAYLFRETRETSRTCRDASAARRRRKDRRADIWRAGRCRLRSCPPAVLRNPWAAASADRRGAPRPWRSVALPWPVGGRAAPSQLREVPALHIPPLERGNTVNFRHIAPLAVP